MPFPDERAGSHVEVVDYRQSWATEASALASLLRGLVPSATAIEHIGSTSIPGMAAKDCLDMMIVVRGPGISGAGTALTSAGFRQRPEPWNNQEPAGGRFWPKQVFAPAVGARAVNIHVRLADAPTARNALLFRDYLRANTTRAEQWAAFKRSAANATEDLSRYGAIKDAAWLMLMDLADTWAASTGWDLPWDPQATDEDRPARGQSSSSHPP